MAITVPTAGTVIDAVTFGAPVANALNPTAWLNLTLQGLWVTVASWQVPQYRKLGDIVMLRGLAWGEPSDSILAILPVGFRPPVNVSFACAIHGVGSHYLTLGSNGEIRPQRTQSYTSLSNVVFSISV